MTNLYFDGRPCLSFLKIFYSQLAKYSARYLELFNIQNNESENSLQALLKPIYDLVKAEEEDKFIFTSSGAAAINHVFYSTFLKYSSFNKNHFLISNNSSLASFSICRRLLASGCSFDSLAVINGYVNPATVLENLSENTILVSLPLINRATGVIQPINEIAEICDNRGILLHLDCSNAFLTKDFSFKDSTANFITLDGPSIGAPYGTGACFIKSDSDLLSLTANDDVYYGIHGSHFSFDSMFALSITAKEINSSLSYLIKIAKLKNLFETTIIKEIKNCSILFQNLNRANNISCIAFDKVHGESLKYYLEQDKIFVSTSIPGYQPLSKILQLNSIDGSLKYNAINIHFSQDCTEENVLTLIAGIKKYIPLLQSISNGLIENLES